MTMSDEDKREILGKVNEVLQQSLVPEVEVYVKGEGCGLVRMEALKEALAKI